jgi:hypothetical protein
MGNDVRFGSLRRPAFATSRMTSTPRSPTTIRSSDSLQERFARCSEFPPRIAPVVGTRLRLSRRRSNRPRSSPATPRVAVDVVGFVPFAATRPRVRSAASAFVKLVA